MPGLFSINPLTSHNSMSEALLNDPHLTDKETEALRCEHNWPLSTAWK